MSDDNKQTYFHSVRLDREKCKGCTNCIKRCPTDAIRVQQGKAKILDLRCIDCGECIRVCPYHAKIAYTDNLAQMNNYKYKIALPAPSLYGQIKNLEDTDQVYSALRMLGFDEVFDVATGAEIVAAAVNEQIKKKEKRPYISSACPAVLRLIAVRFPELIDNVVDVESPMEVAAMLAKKEFAEKHHCSKNEIGAFFITPCPAKVTSIRAPFTKAKSEVDGAISMLEIYGLLTSQMKAAPKLKRESESVSAYGVGWANSGGEASAVSYFSGGKVKRLAVDGVHNVIRALEEIENDKFSDLEFFEGLACTGGCVGGPLVFENGFVAKTRISTICERLAKISLPKDKLENLSERPAILMEKKIEPIEVMKLDSDFVKAMRMMEQIEDIMEHLPGLDCGSCGSPSCRALAEDIVRGHASEMDCIFVLKERVRHLADEMEGLLKKL